VPDSFDRTMARLMTIGSVGTEMVVPIVVGWVIDYYTNLMPLFLIIGSLLGLFVGVRHLVALNKPRSP
jgi:F0F1-type ATP synthase assembly protein I